MFTESVDPYPSHAIIILGDLNLQSSPDADNVREALVFFRL